MLMTNRKLHSTLSIGIKIKDLDDLQVSSNNLGISRDFAHFGGNNG